MSEFDNKRKTAERQKKEMMSVGKSWQVFSLLLPKSLLRYWSLVFS